MTKFSENIIDKIKCNKIAPFPRWHFLLKGYFLWTLFVISVLFGSISFSVVMHIVNSGDLDLSGHLNGNLFTSTVMLLPYFWLLFLGIFAIMAYFNWKCTKHGYRFQRRWIVIGSICLSVFLGSIFYALGMAKKIDELMARSIPFYDQSKHSARRELWFQPDNGLLVGKIINVDKTEEVLMVKDENGNIWNVSDRDVVWESDKLEEKGKIIKVIGKKENENNFSAKEIRKCGDCGDDEDKKETKAENSKASKDKDDIISKDDSE